MPVPALTLIQVERSAPQSSSRHEPRGTSSESREEIGGDSDSDLDIEQRERRCVLVVQQFFPPQRTMSAAEKRRQRRNTTRCLLVGSTPMSLAAGPTPTCTPVAHSAHTRVPPPDARPYHRRIAGGRGAPRGLQANIHTTSKNDNNNDAGVGTGARRGTAKGTEMDSARFELALSFPFTGTVLHISLYPSVSTSTSRRHIRLRLCFCQWHPPPYLARNAPL